MGGCRNGMMCCEIATTRGGHINSDFGAPSTDGRFEIERKRRKAWPNDGVTAAGQADAPLAGRWFAATCSSPAQTCEREGRSGGHLFPRDEIRRAPCRGRGCPAVYIYAASATLKK